MAVSSYGSATSSSGVVRILKDLDRDIQDRDVLIVEDIVDSGLTLSWLLRNLAARHPRSLRVCTLLLKPDAVRTDVDIAYVGFDIPNEFVVGYGLDYAERYRDLPYIGTLDPKVYTHYYAYPAVRRAHDAPATALRICPLCEATCGLTLTVDDVAGTVTAARGDHDDVFSAGFICPKGASFGELDGDPDRLTRPLVRRDGRARRGQLGRGVRGRRRGPRRRARRARRSLGRGLPRQPQRAHDRRGAVPAAGDPGPGHPQRVLGEHAGPDAQTGCAGSTCSATRSRSPCPTWTAPTTW